MVWLRLLTQWISIQYSVQYFKTQHKSHKECSPGYNVIFLLIFKATWREKKGNISSSWCFLSMKIAENAENVQFNGLIARLKRREQRERKRRVNEKKTKKDRWEKDAGEIKAERNETISEEQKLDGGLCMPTAFKHWMLSFFFSRQREVFLLYGIHCSNNTGSYPTDFNLSVRLCVWWQVCHFNLYFSARPVCANVRQIHFLSD